MFEKYCWRHLNEYGRIIAGRDKFHILHMCGKLRGLLPRIDELPAVAIEAYIAPPVGDTTLADRAALCSNTAVIGGTDATLWLQPVEEICARIERYLEEAGGMRGIVPTSAGAAPIGKIKRVRKYLKDFTWNRFA